MKLYELSKAIEAFDLEIDEETGEIINLDELDALQLARDEKIENIALWIKDLTAEAAMIKQEAQNLTKRQKTAEKKAESLKHYLTENLAGEKFKSPRVAISYRKSKSVLIKEPGSIPDEYVVTSVEQKANKVLIRKALEAGEAVRGCELVETQNLQIK